MYSTANITEVITPRRTTWTEQAEREVKHKKLVYRSEVMRPLGKPIRRWYANIKMDAREIGCILK